MSGGPVLAGALLEFRGPGVRVQALVAVVLEDVPVEVAAAALGHEADLAARGAAVLGRVARGQDLDLLHRVDVGEADVRARRTRAERRHAVEGQDVLVGAAAVDDPAAVAEAVGLKVLKALLLRTPA